MLITLTRNIKEEYQIEVQLPYYYEYDLTDYDSGYNNMTIIKGKITENSICSIEYKKYSYSDDVTYEIQYSEDFNDIKRHIESYYEKHDLNISKISEKEFETTKKEAQEFLNKF